MLSTSDLVSNQASAARIVDPAMQIVWLCLPCIEHSACMLVSIQLLPALNNLKSGEGLPNRFVDIDSKLALFLRPLPCPRLQYATPIIWVFVIIIVEENIEIILRRHDRHVFDFYGMWK